MAGAATKDPKDNSSNQEFLRSASDHQHLSAILDAAEVGIWELDPNTREISANATYEALMGREPIPQQITTDEFYARVYLEDRARVEEITYRTACEGRPLVVEYRVQWPDGSLRWLQNRGTAICDEWGRAKKITGVVMDITERKRSDLELKRNKQTLQAIIDNTPAAVFIKDKNGKYLLANKKVKSLFNVEEDILNKNDYDFMPPELAAAVLANDQEVLRTGQPLQREEIVPTGGVNHTYVSVKFPIHIENSDGPAICGISTDITEEIETRDALEDLSAELERSNRDLEQLAYVASHDLKEPIRTITSYLQLLYRSLEGKLDDKSRRYFDFALDGSKRMAQLIDSLLKYARVGSVSLEVEDFDCNALICEVRSNLRKVIEDTGATLNSHSLPMLRSDRIQIGQLFQNLISNALKFRKAGSAPTVEVGCKEGNHEWVFHVNDNGIGVKKEDAKRVFEIFRRLHSRSEYPGQGIGLATCKRIIERQGGRIWLESSPDVGSTVYFTIPKIPRG